MEGKPIREKNELQKIQTWVEATLQLSKLASLNPENQTTISAAFKHCGVASMGTSNTKFRPVVETDFILCLTKPRFVLSLPIST